MRNIAKLPDGKGFYERTEEINLHIDEELLNQKHKIELLEIEQDALARKCARLNDLLIKKQNSEKELKIKLKKIEIRYEDLFALCESYCDDMVYDDWKIEFLEGTLEMYMKNHEIITSENNKLNSIVIKLLELNKQFKELSAHLRYKRKNLRVMTQNYMSAPSPNKEKSQSMILEAFELEKRAKEAEEKDQKLEKA